MCYKYDLYESRKWKILWRTWQWVPAQGCGLILASWGAHVCNKQSFQPPHTPSLDVEDPLSIPPTIQSCVLPSFNGIFGSQYTCSTSWTCPSWGLHRLWLTWLLHAGKNGLRYDKDHGLAVLSTLSGYQLSISMFIHPQTTLPSVVNILELMYTWGCFYTGKQMAWRAPSWCGTYLGGLRSRLFDLWYLWWI